MITDSKLKEVFYECYRTCEDERNNNLSPLDVVTFLIFENIKEDNLEEFSEDEIARYNKENAIHL